MKGPKQAGLVSLRLPATGSSVSPRADPESHGLMLLIPSEGGDLKLRIAIPSIDSCKGSVDKESKPEEGRYQVLLEVNAPYITPRLLLLALIIAFTDLFVLLISHILLIIIVPVLHSIEVPHPTSPSWYFNS